MTEQAISDRKPLWREVLVYLLRFWATYWILGAVWGVCFVFVLIFMSVF
jgi:hypothetical protein